jgi:hypothetical protein
MKKWGFAYERFKFPDLGLMYFSLKKMVRAVSRVVLRKNITKLVSFYPYEVTSGFDHSDHNRAGEVARLISVGMKGKRKLIFWISDGKPYFIGKRDKYAKSFYPSQKIPIVTLKTIGESYLKIR